MIGILPAGGEVRRLRLLVAGKLLPFQVVGEVFLFAGVVVVLPVDLFADRHSLSIYVKIISLIFLAHGDTSESLKSQVFKLSGAAPDSGAISRQSVNFL